MSTDTSDKTAQAYVTVGKIGAPYGVRGWLKIHSYTDPVEGILNYENWWLAGRGELKACAVAQGRVHGKGLVVQLEGIADRDVAAQLTGAQIQIPRDSLPILEDGYYWLDLIGMDVIDRQGQAHGTVSSMMETGANDVMVVDGDRQRLIPWVMDDVVISVDKREGIITVDWDRDF